MIGVDTARSGAAIEGVVELASDKTTSPEQAATCIQSLIRGVLLRKSLPPQLCFEMQYGKIIRRAEPIEHTEASDGNTPVWFPKACPGIIMKFSGDWSSSRLAEMNRIREVLATQESSHAIVPIGKIGAKDGKIILVEEDSQSI